MRIAFVYDRVNKFGGAERVLSYMHEIWPKAPLYTAVYDKKNSSWADIFTVRPSILRFLPSIQKKHEWLLFALPFAFERMNFDEYDAVISVTSAEAKGIITKPSTMHVCYCLTPTRYLWSGYEQYLEEPGFGKINFLVRILMKMVFPKLRKWDYIACSRPDYYISISETVASRIKKYYGKDSKIIYPPVEIDKFFISKQKTKSAYFLIVSRLVPYKKIDYIIRAFNKINQKLIIIGNGLDYKRLKNLAGSNVKFITDYLTDEELCCYYQNCIALIFPGEEDFGLTIVEAQCCGRGVIAYNKGGVREIIQNGKTGILYGKQDESTFLSVIKSYDENRFSPLDCRKNALRFSKKKFQTEIKNKIIYLMSEYKKNL
jgi:glycosyltransferase involved in cell wall biosynthesis